MPSFFVRLLCLVSSPRFLAWLFSPAFKDNKVISSFSTFLRLLLSFFDIPRIISQFFAPLLSLHSLFRASWCSPHRFAGLCVSSLTSFCLLSFYLLLFLIQLFFLFSFFLSHLTFPAYLSLLFHYPLIDSVQCDKPLFLIFVVLSCAVCPWKPAFLRTSY